jgi:hypothetical protein
MKRTTRDTFSIVVGDHYSRGRPRHQAPQEHRFNDGPDVIELQLSALTDGVRCIYRRFSPGLEPLEIGYTILVSWTPANLGGRRPWFHCSHDSCRRRVARLFLTSGFLVCQRCAGVRYPSQTEPQTRHVWTVARARAIRLELGGRPVVGAPFPAKPTRMHQKRYERLRSQVLEIEREEDERINRAITNGELSFTGEMARLLREAIDSDDDD